MNAVIKAAEEMDWQQVVLNGGPPCFYLCEDGRFCGRSKRWIGHIETNDVLGFRVLDHDFVSLAQLIERSRSTGVEEGK